jgi:hypothetical protein
VRLRNWPRQISDWVYATGVALGVPLEVLLILAFLAVVS